MPSPDADERTDRAFAPLSDVERIRDLLAQRRRQRLLLLMREVEAGSCSIEQVRSVLTRDELEYLYALAAGYDTTGPESR